MRKVTNGLNLLGQRITNLGDPASGQDAATKTYVDNTIRGLQYKDSVRVASTADVNIAAAPANIDGVALAANDRVLLKNQATASQNGIWVFNGTGAALTRAADLANGVVVRPAIAVDVVAGATNADQVWHITSPDVDVTVGTDATTWSQLGGGSGVSSFNGRSGAVNQTKADITGTGLAAADIGATAKFSVAIGDGAATALDVNHNLGTRDVVVTVYDATTFDEVVADINHATVNKVTVTFATAPAAGAYRVVVVG